MSADSSARWSILSASVRGTTHVRAGVPNQDAVQVEMQPDGKLLAIIAVSDGHGSPKCFRSHVGSRLAVEIAAAVLREFALSETGAPDDADTQSVIACEIVRRWRIAVANHLATQPIAAEEWAGLETGVVSRLRRSIEVGEPHVIYGATLVCAVACANWLCYLQLGDGEILAGVRSQNGHGVEQPLANSELIANETTSLCQEEAAELFRWNVQPLDDTSPALILLATDGYPNSFATPEGFRQVATDLLAMLDQEGMESVAASLPGWLEEASQLGSGDDVSVAILYRSPEAPRHE